MSNQSTDKAPKCGPLGVHFMHINAKLKFVIQTSGQMSREQCACNHLYKYVQWDWTIIMAKPVVSAKAKSNFVPSQAKPRKDITHINLLITRLIGNWCHCWGGFQNKQHQGWQCCTLTWDVLVADSRPSVRGNWTDRKLDYSKAPTGTPRIRNTGRVSNSHLQRFATQEIAVLLSFAHIQNCRSGRDLFHAGAYRSQYCALISVEPLGAELADT